MDIPVATLLSLIKVVKRRKDYLFILLLSRKLPDPTFDYLILHVL